MSYFNFSVFSLVLQLLYQGRVRPEGVGRPRPSLRLGLDLVPLVGAAGEPGVQGAAEGLNGRVALEKAKSIFLF